MITPNDYIFEHANKASSEIYKSVCTLFSQSEGGFQMEGSGLLFLLNEELYVVSASHVFENLRTLYMPINNTIAVIEGGLWCGDPNKAMEEHRDVVDIAVFKIELSYKSDILNSYKVLTEKDIAVLHFENSKSFYLMVANTSSKTRFDRVNKTVKAESFSYVGTHADDKKYIENGFDKKYFLIVNYDRKRIERDNDYCESRSALVELGMIPLLNTDDQSGLHNHYLAGVVFPRDRLSDF